MSEIPDLFFQNNQFQYLGCGCKCVVDTLHKDLDSEPELIFKVQAENPATELQFAYAASKGLVKLEKGTGIVEENILGKILSIDSNDTDSLMDFFNNYGFLFPVTNTSYESINARDLISIVNHIKATVQLMSEVSEAKRLNYDKILMLTLYLLFSEPVEITFSDGAVYSSCEHFFQQELKKASILTDSTRQQEAQNSYQYSINDLVYPPSYSLDVSEYNEIISGYQQTPVGSNNPLYVNITKLYCDLTNADPIIRLTTDFLFHYEHDVGIIRNIDYDMGIEYYTAPNKDNFDKYLKNALLQIAKYVVGEEINAHLSGIYPEYNSLTMGPSWQINTLMDAIYFSIFYLKPELELYRKCENPSCENYFLVKTTFTKKKYCCEQCANAAQQRRHRLRQKKGRI